jgi:nicotinamide riboside kinase
MRIAIVGSMGVGKTTFANQLAEVTGYKLLPEIARMLAERGIKVDKRVTVETEKQIFKLQLEAEATEGDWIADRCLIDLLAYVVELFPDDADLIADILEKVNEAKYDLILYIPPEFTVANDKLRTTDPVFRWKIDKRIKAILRKKHNYHWIEGPEAMRVRKALQIIQNKKI